MRGVAWSDSADRSRRGDALWRGAEAMLRGVEPLRWETDGSDWPNRGTSRFVRAGGIRWHVQQTGSGPELLLLHGTGASTHSWRDLLPALATRFSVVAPDLPGHGFSEAPRPSALSIDGMVASIAALLDELSCRPRILVGHSAGAAVACRAALDGVVDPERVVSLNGALLPFGGPAQRPLAHLTRILTLHPWLPRVFAWRGRDPCIIERMVRGTGSRLDAEGLRLYGLLLGNPHQVTTALRMMSRWNLRPLVRDLPRLGAALQLVVGDRDRYIDPAQSLRVQSLVPRAERVVLPGFGHLAHEEDPARIAALLHAGGASGVAA